jgi:hypothetical protein
MQWWWFELRPTTPETAAQLGWYYIAPVATPADVATLRAEVAALREALEGIANWCEAYPPTVFTQESADRALAACKAHSIPVDAMHGTWARHLMAGIGRDARAALAPKENTDASDV